MIISHRWRCIFIKGHKVAGTSVEMALSTICGPDDIITPITPRDDADRLRVGGFCQNYAVELSAEALYRAGITDFIAAQGKDYAPLLRLRPAESRYYNHMSLREVFAAFPHDISDYRVFCVERCPYRKAMSLVHMDEHYHRYEAGESMTAKPENLHRQMDAAISNGTILRARNVDLYKDATGKIAVQVLRYNNLTADFAALLQAVGAPPVMLPHAKQGLSADLLDPRDMLRWDQIRTLNELLHDDFEAFGYPMLTS